VVALLLESTQWGAQLEGPQEVVGFLEVGAHGVNLVYQVLNADDAELSKCLLNDGVVGQSGAGLVQLAVTTLVDQLTDTLQVGVPVEMNYTIRKQTRQRQDNRRQDNPKLNIL
jgi:hypothetical protein